MTGPSMSVPFAAPLAPLTPQRVHHLNPAITLPVCQVLGVKNRGSAALGGMQDQRVPVRNLLPRFDPKRCDDHLRSVNGDLPTQVVYPAVFH